MKKEIKRNEAFCFCLWNVIATSYKNRTHLEGTWHLKKGIEICEFFFGERERERERDGNGGAVAGEGVGGVVREDRDGFGIRFG